VRFKIVTYCSVHGEVGNAGQECALGTAQEYVDETRCDDPRVRAEPLVYSLKVGDKVDIASIWTGTVGWQYRNMVWVVHHETPPWIWLVPMGRIGPVPSIELYPRRILIPDIVLSVWEGEDRKLKRIVSSYICDMVVRKDQCNA